MESNNYIEFTVMITFPELLEIKIQEFNFRFKTNFELLEIIDDEVQFCRIGVSEYTYGDLFNLGYSLAAKQYTMKMKGEIDW